MRRTPSKCIPVKGCQKESKQGTTHDSACRKPSYRRFSNSDLSFGMPSVVSELSITRKSQKETRRKPNGRKGEIWGGQLLRRNWQPLGEKGAKGGTEVKARRQSRDQRPTDRRGKRGARERCGSETTLKTRWGDRVEPTNTSRKKTKQRQEPTQDERMRHDGDNGKEKLNRKGARKKGGDVEQA